MSKNKNRQQLHGFSNLVCSNHAD